MDQIRKICVLVIWGTVAWLVWLSGDRTAGMNEQQWLSQALPFYAILVVVAYAAHRFVARIFHPGHVADRPGDDGTNRDV